MIHSVCKDIMQYVRINKFIETGTFVGETVAVVSNWFQKINNDFGVVCGHVTEERFASLYKRKTIHYPVFKNSNSGSTAKIYSVDVDKGRQEILKELFRSNPNVNIVEGSSEIFIKGAIESGLVNDSDRCFFYLDAHWGKHWPLRDEIREILKLRKSVIVVDDFIVPWHPSHGFDVYRTKICGWYHIRNLFNQRSDITVFYTKKSNEDKRGTVIIFRVGIYKTIALFQTYFFERSPVDYVRGKANRFHFSFNRFIYAVGQFLYS